MATSSITGADHAPSQAEGRDDDALGPSDSSDSGSDVQGELDLVPHDDDAREASDILPDKVTRSPDALADEGPTDAELDLAELTDLDQRTSDDSDEDDESESGRADEGRS